MLAKIQGVFRLTRDLELKYLADGTAVAKLGLACSEKYKDKETQLFLEASVFGKVSELLNQYASTKGTQIFLAGKLKTEQWEANGQKHSKVVMMIEDFQFLGSNNSTQQQAPQQRPAPQYEYQNAQGQQTPPPQRQMSQQPPVIDINEDDIPF